jgi:Tfp pilus assembly protein FimT
MRGLALLVTVAVAAVLTLVVLAYSSSWTNGNLRDHQGHRGTSQGLGG